MAAVMFPRVAVGRRGRARSPHTAALSPVACGGAASFLVFAANVASVRHAPVDHEVVAPHLVGASRRIQARPAGGDAPARPFHRHAAAAPGATAGTPPGRTPSHAPHGAERSRSGSSCSADTARQVSPSARAPPRPSPPSASDSRAPSGPPRSACRPAAATGPDRSHTIPRRGGPARSPVFTAISFITSISRSRSTTGFFSRAFSSCRSRRTSFGCERPEPLRHV